MNSTENHRLHIIPFMDQHEIRAINSCFDFFDFPVRVLEWGSGKSTVYFSNSIFEGSTWLAIEHNQEWVNEVKEMLKTFSNCTVNVKYVPTDLDYVEGNEDGNYSQFESYINFPDKTDQEAFHVIIVDGRARVECMKAGWDLLGNDGIMILHDAQRKEYTPGIPDKAFTVRIINLEVYSEGNLSTLFMCKTKEVAKQFVKELENNLPAFIQIETSFEQNRIYQSNDKSGSESCCVFLNTYYQGFIKTHYDSNKGLENKSYLKQLNSLQESNFGDSDFYSQGMELAGWKAEDLIINCDYLQFTWARENLLDCKSILDIAVEQIKRIRPDVIYFQDLNYATEEFIKAIRPYAKLIVGQIASPLPANAALQDFDLIISSFPHFVERLRHQGITAYYQPLAFSEDIAEKKDWSLREHDLSFVGGVSVAHTEGTKLLERLAVETPIEFWGYGRETLPENSPIREKHHGEVWGKEMFAVLQNSKITINRHIDVAENYANNMRLFEATGCGALLITDYKDNLNELFEIGKEIVVYRSIEECTALVKYYLKHPEKAAEIAARGQERTLRDHSYNARMTKTAEILNRHLRYKWYEKPASIDLNAVSCEYTESSVSQVTESQEKAWQNETIPVKQRALIQHELKGLYKNNIPFHYQVLAESIKAIANNDCKILEIGCASGYYYEILEYLLGINIDYTGVDYSPSLIAMAEDYYPSTKFCVADGASTPFEERQFEIVISSCVLLHVKDYYAHIEETVRIADKYMVLHRTPVSRKRITQFYDKLAYGVETFEIRFNESELIMAILNSGFELIGCYEIFSDESLDQYDNTYVFKRI